MKLIKRIILASLWTGFINIAWADFDPATGNLELTPEEIEMLKSNSPFGPISEKEIMEAQEFFNKLTPEEKQEIEKLSQDFLNDLQKAFDEEQEASVQSEQSSEPEPKVEEEKSKPIAKPTLKQTDKEFAKKLIRALISNIQELKQEAQNDDSVARRLNAWITDINDLVYYLNVLDKDSLIAHLVSSDFQRIYNNLIKLNDALEESIALFKVKAVLSEETEDPYEVLGISTDASTEDIEAAFNRLKNERDPQIVEKKLQEEGLSEKDIQRKVKEARLSFGLIETAYESLKDPKSRKQVDLDMLSRQGPEKKSKNVSQKAFNKILKAFGTAFYDDAILADIKKLLEKYEPEAIERKKQIEQAQQEAKKAQEEISKRKITPTPSRPEYKPTPRYRPEEYERPSYYPYQPSPFLPHENVEQQPKKEEKKEEGKGGGSGGGGTGSKKAGEGKESEKDKKGDKNSSKKGKDGGKDKDKNKEDKVVKLIDEVAKYINNFNNKYVLKLAEDPQDDANKDLIKALNATLIDVPLSTGQKAIGDLNKELSSIKDKKDLKEYKKLFEKKIEKPFKTLIDKVVNIFSTNAARPTTFSPAQVDELKNKMKNLISSIQDIIYLLATEDEILKVLEKIVDNLQVLAQKTTADAKNTIEATTLFDLQMKLDDFKKLKSLIEKAENKDKFKDALDVLTPAEITNIENVRRALDAVRGISAAASSRADITNAIVQTLKDLQDIVK